MPNYAKDIPAREREMDRKFTVLLYPDSEDYNIQQVLDKLVGWGYEEWAYIMHDQDKKEDGSGYKKEHIHAILRKSTPTALGTIARQLGVSPQYVQRVRNWKKMVQYLTHEEATGKTKYEIESIVSSDPEKIKLYFRDEDETEQAAKILQYIVDSGCRSYIQLIEWCCKEGLYSTCRRNASMWSNCLKENERYGVREQ